MTIQKDVLDNQEILKNFNSEAELKALRDDADKKLEKQNEQKNVKSSCKIGLENTLFLMVEII